MVVWGTEILTEALNIGLTVIEITFELAVVGLTQAAFEVRMQVTCAPLLRFVVEYVVPVPAGTPFTNHCNIGVGPPFIEVAVKVTFCPSQIKFEEAVILTLGVSTGLTVIETEFELTLAWLTQAAFEVMTQ